MPKLTALTQANRIAQCIQVMRLMADGRSQAEACEEVGITPDIFRRWNASDPDALAAFRELVYTVERNELTEIVAARQVLFQRVLQNALENPDDLGAAWTLIQYLDKRIPQLAQSYNLDHAREDEANEFLKGPKRKPGQSRFAAGANVDVTADEDGGVNVHITPKTIIEG